MDMRKFEIGQRVRVKSDIIQPERFRGQEALIVDIRLGQLGHYFYQTDLQDHDGKRVWFPEDALVHRAASCYKCFKHGEDLTHWHETRTGDVCPNCAPLVKEEIERKRSYDYEARQYLAASGGRINMGD